MKCPHCQTEISDVKDTRHKSGGVVRMRVCFNGHKFQTVERAVAYTPRKKLKALA